MLSFLLMLKLKFIIMLNIKLSFFALTKKFIYNFIINTNFSIDLIEKCLINVINFLLLNNMLND